LKINIIFNALTNIDINYSFSTICNRVNHWKFNWLLIHLHGLIFSCRNKHTLATTYFVQKESLQFNKVNKPGQARKENYILLFPTSAHQHNDIMSKIFN
jgi:hypothetical protein